MTIERLEIIAADAASAKSLHSFTCGHEKAGLLVLEGPADSRAYDLACLLAGLDPFKEACEPCFSTATKTPDGIAATVVHLGFWAEDPEEELAAEVADFLKDPAGNLLVIVALDGEPVVLCDEAAKVAVRVRLATAGSAVAAS
jgi:hypothetical protein